MNKKWTFYNWYKEDINKNPHKYFKGFVTIIGTTLTLTLLTSITCLFLKKVIEVLRIYRTKEHLKVISNAISNYATNHGILPYPAHDLKKGYQASLPRDEDDLYTNQEIYTKGFVPYATLGISKEYAFDGNKNPIIYYLNPTLGKRTAIPNAPITEPLLLASNTTNLYHKVSKLNSKIFCINPESAIKKDINGLTDGIITATYYLKLYTNYLYCRYSDDPQNKNDLCAMTKSHFGLRIFINNNMIEIDEQEMSIHKSPGLFKELSDIKEMEELEKNGTFQKPINIIAFALVSYKEPQSFPSQPNLIHINHKGDHFVFVSRANISIHDRIYNYNSAKLKPSD